MPVDFNRVPPRVAVPPPPQVSMIVWTVLLVLVMCAGAGLAIMLWPADRPINTLWFWFCAVGYPFLVWAFGLFAWFGYGYARRNQALATNRVSDEAEQACHALAARPLAILGHAWCFAANDSENALEGILNGSELSTRRPSGAVADSDVHARWLDIPDLPFHPGNELVEHARHHAIGMWLLERLIDDLLPQLSALPPRTQLQVELQHRSRVTSESVETRIRELIAERVPVLKIDLMPGKHTSSLFRTDAWLDKRDVNTAHLLIAVELRDAISTVLSGGVAEAGVALLVGGSRLASTANSVGLRLHRPAKDSLDGATRTVGLAARWGRSSLERLRTVWTHGLTRDSVGAVRQTARFPDQTHWNVLENSVGDCSGAGPWLAVALAAESARITGDSQMVLCGDGKDLIALVCRKQT
ncbi:TPA: hypothetical protein RJR39_000302 [Burkholderia cenocepacia]|uniref:hypothetical protein n=1 Tax=Burkholderia cenocepacia TaxID=95486 RepID=UPI001B9F52E1|nr:hypothetical protein [Burkholderia cenocepacia]MBR8196729.1 hypothetical protein [Burkholderia cenocepacia]HDV6324270.1 hypothetical protein [Burkholderia cenocepacia]HDV6350856.1 hypothetical protein [Burkholderia cenocepacia]